MKNYTRRYFSCADAQAIRNAVAEVESVTSGEILPVIRSCSSRYRYPLLKWILICQICYVAVWGVSAVFPNNRIGAAEILFFLGGYLMLIAAGLILPEVFPSFLRLLAGDRRIDESVTTGAVEAFVRYGVSSTRKRTGILIYISLFEHRVVILADQGIHKKVNPDIWKKVSDAIAHDMKNGAYAEALIRAIASCRNLLAEFFPPSSDDRNELPDLMIME